MTCPDAKTWNLLSMNLLDEDRAELLRQHSLECERCCTTWQGASRQHTELLDTFQAFDCNHDQRRDQLMAMLPQSVPLSEKEPGTVQRAKWLGEIVMTIRRHKTRWAAVTLLPAACILLVFLLMTGDKIAFADVLQTMRQAKTMICDFVTTTTVLKGELPEELTKNPLRGTIAMYFDGKTRATLNEWEQFGKKSRVLFRGDKAYLWDGDKVRVLNISPKLSQQQATEVSQQQALQNWLSRLLEVRESPDRNLGEQTINGRRTVGFEIAGWKLGYGTRPTKGSPTPTDSELQLRVWVDIEQNVPIRMETERKMVMPDVTAKIHHRWDNIKWNVALDANDFCPPAEADIAKDETIQVPTPDEATFIGGMRAWLESKDKAQAGVDMAKKKAQEKGEELPPQLTILFERAALDAGYPERLDMSWLSGTYSARATMAMLADTMPGMKPLPKGLDKEEREKQVHARAKESATATATVATQAMLKAMAVSAFYRKLANEQRNPEYFGATVKPGDAEAILLKWRLDDGRYRVIRGDLRAETVDAED